MYAAFKISITFVARCISFSIEKLFQSIENRLFLSFQIILIVANPIFSRKDSNAIEIMSNEQYIVRFLMQNRNHDHQQTFWIKSMLNNLEIKNIFFLDCRHDCIALDAVNIMANGQYIDRFIMKSQKLNSISSSSCNTLWLPNYIYRTTSMFVIMEHERQE